MKPIIPEAALGQHIAVLGKTGSGKTFAAKASIVEPLLELGRRVSVVDPTGAWWGLRSSRDGKGPGYPVIVLGGDHGDLPLPANGGAAVARLITEQGVNLVADTSQLTMGESARWFVDFAGTLYRSNKTPLHLVIDEAHNFAPQGKVPDPDTGKMLHAANKLASGGRSRGIRLVMITQRPQKLHKDTLTSADTLIAMRVLAPQDREAVEDWIKGCGDREHGKEVLNSLASLKRGEGWVWYPEGVHLKRAHFPEIRTFDSSATPTDGGAIAAPKGAAQIDLAEIRAALADAVKEAEANDPKLLRAEISKLKAELAKKPGVSVSIDTGTISQAEIRGRMAGRDDVLNKLSAARTYLTRAGDEIGRAAAHLDIQLPPLEPLRVQTSSQPKAPPQAPRAAIPGRRPADVPSSPAAAADVSGPQQRILDALAWLEAVGINDAHRVQLALLAKASPKSSSYQNNCGALRTAGLIDYVAGRVVLTPAGRAAAEAPETPPTTQDLHITLQLELPGPQWKILEQLIKLHPSPVDKSTLADLAGASVSSSSYQNNLGALRSLGFIEYPERGMVAAQPVLFLG